MSNRDIELALEEMLKARRFALQGVKHLEASLGFLEKSHTMMLQAEDNPRRTAIRDSLVAEKDLLRESLRLLSRLRNRRLMSPMDTRKVLQDSIIEDDDKRRAELAAARAARRKEIAERSQA